VGPVDAGVVEGLPGGGGAVVDERSAPLAPGRHPHAHHDGVVRHRRSPASWLAASTATSVAPLRRSPAGARRPAPPTGQRGQGRPVVGREPTGDSGNDGFVTLTARTYPSAYPGYKIVARGGFGMEIGWTVEEEAFRAEVRDWLEANKPPLPMPSGDTAAGIGA